MKMLKKLFCKIGWHSFIVGYDLAYSLEDPLHSGICDRYRCKWCNGVGLVDSQGNLFNVKKEKENEDNIG